MLNKDLILKFFEFIKSKKHYKVPIRFLLANFPYRKYTNDELTINEDITLSNFEINYSITKLPDNLKIDGYLDLTQCYGLKKLPKNMQVKSLGLVGTNINVLPDDLIVTKYIKVPNNKINWWNSKYPQYKFI